MKLQKENLFSSLLVISLLAIGGCSSKDDAASSSNIPEGEIVTITQAKSERDFSLYVVADADGDGPKDMQFYVTTESPPELHDLLKSNVGKKIRIGSYREQIYAAEELSGARRFAGVVLGTEDDPTQNSDVEEKPVEVAPRLEFPYKAIIKCHYGEGNIPLFACMSNDGINTELELTNGQEYGMYTTVDLIQQRIGTVRRDNSVEIDLRENFDLTIQNANETYLINVKIIDQASGEKLFEKSASQYRSVAVKN